MAQEIPSFLDPGLGLAQDHVQSCTWICAFRLVYSKNLPVIMENVDGSIIKEIASPGKKHRILD